MTLFVDARIPVVFGAPDDAADGDAVLMLDGVRAPTDRPLAPFARNVVGHPAGCTCCVPRNAAATALAGLFVARARGEVPFFRRVILATAATRDAVELRRSLFADPLISGRFRDGEDSASVGDVGVAVPQ